MDSDRFDRWTKIFALRMSRRTAAGLGAATVAAFSSPYWVLGQDDDDDPTPDDQGTDDQPSNDDASDDTPQDNQDDDDESSSEEQVGDFPCLPIIQCKTCETNMLNNEQICVTVGPIPDGPWEQEWCWSGRDCVIPQCRPKDAYYYDLVDLCNRTYPKTGDVWNIDCRRGCCPAPAFNILGC